MQTQNELTDLTSSGTRYPTGGLWINWDKANRTTVSWWRFDEPNLDTGNMLSDNTYPDGVEPAGLICLPDTYEYSDESSYLMEVEGLDELHGDDYQSVSSECDFRLDNTTDRFTPQDGDNIIEINPGFESNNLYGWSIRSGTGNIVEQTGLPDATPVSGNHLLRIIKGGADDPGLHSNFYAIGSGAGLVGSGSRYVGSCWASGNGILSLDIRVASSGTNTSALYNYSVLGHTKSGFVLNSIPTRYSLEHIVGEADFGRDRWIAMEIDLGTASGNFACVDCAQLEYKRITDLYDSGNFSSTEFSDDFSGYTTTSGMAEVYSRNADCNMALEFDRNDGYLLAEWRFDGTEEDSSGNGLTLTPVNSPTYTMGKIGQCVSLIDSSSQYFTATSSTLNMNTGSITIEAWVKRRNTGALQHTVIAMGNTDTLNYAIDFYQDCIRFFYNITGPSTRVWTSSGKYGSTQWQHLVLTHTWGDNDSTKIYLDGNSISGSWNGDAVTPITSNNTLRIGARQEGLYFNGLIDEVRILNRALTPDEIAVRYASGMGSRLGNSNTSALKSMVIAGTRNLIHNGGFEQGFASWNKVENNSGGSTYTFNVVSNEKKEGTYSLKITSTDTSTSADVSQYVAVQSGYTYNFSMWRKMQGVSAGYNARAYLQNYDANFNDIGSSTTIGSANGTEDWTKYTGTHTAISGTSYVRINLYSGYANAGDTMYCWWDDIKLSLVSDDYDTASNVIKTTPNYTNFSFQAKLKNDYYPYQYETCNSTANWSISGGDLETSTTDFKQGTASLTFNKTSTTTTSCYVYTTITNQNLSGADYISFWFKTPNIAGDIDKINYARVLLYTGSISHYWYYYLDRQRQFPLSNTWYRIIIDKKSFSAGTGSPTWDDIDRFYFYVYTYNNTDTLSTMKLDDVCFINTYNQSQGLIFRRSDDNNYYRFINKDCNNFALQKIVDGIATDIAVTSGTAYSPSIASGWAINSGYYYYGVRAHGDTIDCFFDKESINFGDDSLILLSGTDDTYSSGTVGIYNESTNTLVDDIKIDNLVDTDNLEILYEKGCQTEWELDGDGLSVEGPKELIPGGSHDEYLPYIGFYYHKYASTGYREWLLDWTNKKDGRTSFCFRNLSSANWGSNTWYIKLKPNTTVYFRGWWKGQNSKSAHTKCAYLKKNFSAGTPFNDLSGYTGLDNTWDWSQWKNSVTIKPINYWGCFQNMGTYQSYDGVNFGYTWFDRAQITFNPNDYDNKGIILKKNTNYSDFTYEAKMKSYYTTSQYSSCDSATNWTGTYGTLAVDTTDKKEGTGCLTLNKTSASYNNCRFQYALDNQDLTSYDYFSFWVKTPASQTVLNMMNYLNVIFYTTSTSHTLEWYIHDRYFSKPNTWYQVVLDKNSFSYRNGGNFDWGNIDGFQLRVYHKSASNTYTTDYWKLDDISFRSSKGQEQGIVFRCQDGPDGDLNCYKFLARTPHTVVLQKVVDGLVTDLDIAEYDTSVQQDYYFGVKCDGSKIKGYINTVPINFKTDVPRVQCDDSTFVTGKIGIYNTATHSHVSYLKVQDKGSPTTYVDDFIGHQLRPKRLMRVRTGFKDDPSRSSGSQVLQFTGLVEEFTPNLRDDDIAGHALDFSSELKDKQAIPDMYVRKPTDYLIKVLALQSGLDESQYSDTIESGTTIIDFAWFQEGSLWYYMQNIAEAEGGRVFFDKEGKLHFWNRNHFWRTDESVAIFSFDDITNMEYKVDASKLKNRIVVKSEPRKLMGFQRVWRENNNIKLDPGETVTVWANINDGNNRDMPCASPDGGTTPAIEKPVGNAPAGHSTYVVKDSDSSDGKDYTSSVSLDNWYAFAKDAKMVFTNNSSIELNITKLELYGYPAKIDRNIEVVAQDDESIDEYGVQELQIENNYIDSEVFAESIATFRLKELKDPTKFIDIDIVGDVRLEVGDNVICQLDYDGHYDAFKIVRNKWTLADDFTQRLSLEKVVADIGEDENGNKFIIMSWFTLDESRLDETDFLTN